VSKKKTLKTRLLYVLAVVAVLAMLIPLAASPVSAQTPIITPGGAGQPEAHDVIGDIETFTVSGLPANVTVVSWSVSNTANGAANAIFVPPPPAGSTTANVTAFGWGESAITVVLSNGTTLTAFKKWGKIDATSISDPQNVSVVWNESLKIWTATATVTDTVTGTFAIEKIAVVGDGTGLAPGTHYMGQFEGPINGVQLNWFLLKDNPATQAWLAAQLAAGSPAGWVDPAATVAWLMAHPTWWATFASFNGPKFTTTFTPASGISSVTVTTTGEEPVLVVVVPQYPNGAVPELDTPIEWTKINFWTSEMEKVSQVRWAGEKIVLEKFFGTEVRPNSQPGATAPIPWYGTLVRFSLENQSPGALEGIGPGGILGNFTNTSQTVWTIVDRDGYARVILVSEAPGEADVDLAVYNENIFVGGDGEILEPSIIINQHGFVVFFLKLEEITLGNVQGKRAGHNTGLFEPPNPWNPASDVTAETLNVSQDALLRARVKGWFEGDNMSTRPERIIDYDPTFDSDGNGILTDDEDLLLPRGRWVLPDDWAKLAGPDWAEQRIHWDIMDNPFDSVMSAAPNDADPWLPAPVPGYHGLGPYYKPVPSANLVAAYPVIGPFRPGIELPTYLGYDPAIPSWAVPQQKSVVPNGALEWWDAPMPPSKITFEILNVPSLVTLPSASVGFFKDAYKSDIYYVWSNPTLKTGKLYTNPFYFENIPAHPQIPAFVNNGGYDWDSWDMSYGPYEFWKVINRPPGAVPSSDSSNYPTKVQVYSDNHGEAMVWLNGNWNLNLGPWLSNGAADVPQGAVVGASTVVAMADYPYFRKHAKLVSNTVTKTWVWGGVILGTDAVLFPGGATQAATPMVLSTGTYVITGGTYPNEVGTSPKKLVWLWITDRDISPAGVMDARIRWSVSGGGTVTIADFGHVNGVSTYNPLTMAIQLDNGFLSGTGGMVTAGTSGTQGTSGVKAPNATEAALFLKFYPTLDPNDFVVAAVELLTSNSTIDVTVQALITSKDFGLVPWTTGTLIRNVNVNFAASYPLDDEPVYGDANADGTVNMGDVIAVERIILGLKSLYIGADANIDYSVDMGDVVKIERTILGLK